MSFQLPKLQELLDRTRAAFRAQLPGSDAWIWPNNIGPTAKVIAGSVFEVFGFAAYIAKMIFASTAPDLETLKLHANEYGLSLRPASPASGTCTITSTGDLSVALGAVLSRTDGLTYRASAEVSRIGAGAVIFGITAVTPGASSNAPAGTPLVIVSGIADANGDATAAVSAPVVGGTDVEDMETFRARILMRKRYTPQGGAGPDYVQWAADVVGVTRAFVERLWAGAGTVRVFVFMDDLYPNGIPPIDAVARVADFIDTVRPAGAIVTVAAPSPVPINVTISGLNPDTAQERENVLASLREAFQRHSVVAGIDPNPSNMPFVATPQVFSRSWITQAVSNATGEERHTLTAPAVDVPLDPGQTAILGTVTFTG